MSSPNSPVIRTAQVASIFLSTFAAGTSSAVAFLFIPRLLESPTPLMLRHWLKIYNINKIFFPIVGDSAAAGFYLLSWYFRRTGGVSSKLYLAAGLACSSIGPYTWLVVFPTNKKLMRKIEETRDLAATAEVDETTVQREETAKWLVDHWGILSLPRVVLLGLGGILGLAATLSER